MNYFRLFVLLTLMWLLSLLHHQSKAAAQQKTVKFQELEAFVQRLEYERGVAQFSGMTGALHPGKCGLSAWFDVQQHWNEFSESQRHRLEVALTEPLRQKDRVLGHFRIYYDTAGTPNVPALVTPSFARIDGTVEQYVDSVGEYFNRAWSIEIDSLGYSRPPLPPDGKYRVYVTGFLEYGLYGRTTPESTSINSGEPSRYATYIEVDDDYGESWFGTSRGLPALQVTAAHEFHHSIQLGSYGAWWSDIYFYEVTSTWMEDVVYPDVNDYYQSLDPTKTSQFSHPEIAFTRSYLGIEYSRAVWGKYIEKRFSRLAMRRTWEYMRQVPSIQAIDNALAELGSSFRSAFLEYSYWNFFTGIHADTVKYYSEGNHYPSMVQRPERNYFAPELVIDDSLGAVASLYQPIRASGGNMMTIISNIKTGSQYSPLDFRFSYSLAASESPGAKHLSNGLYSRIFNVSDPAEWAAQDTIPTLVNDVVVYPNPFLPKGNKPLKFHLPQTSSTSASLTILTASLGRFYSGELPILPLEPVVEWNAHDAEKHAIPSGIYIFVIDVDDKQYVGKFAVIQ